MKARRWVALALVTCTLAASPAQAGRLAPTADRAEELLDAMTPEQRVGQLFLVGFDGIPSESDPLFDLVRRGQLSGVVLRSTSDNFAAFPMTLGETSDLIRSLQGARVGAGGPASPTPSAQEDFSAVYVPLLVGVSLNRERTPYPEILGGLSEPATGMALGATWEPDLARQVGAQVGRELAALGFNLVFGPSLDVLDESTQGSPGDLGAEAFGGDPYWVSQMGTAYVTGLHQGSSGRMAVIAKHFPGIGGSDRPPGEEVATIRKSLDTLRLVDLAPFLSVTSGIPGADAAVVEGLLLSHIRYQGLQGNIRQTTRPVSLDRAALEQILSLEGFVEWRQGGGVIVADSLGSRAVRRFYDPAEQSFNGPLVAREAFLAGSDLLLLENFISAGDPDSATTIGKTLTAFTNRYVDDPVFAEQVDTAALRVLRLKLHLYGGTFDSQEIQKAILGPDSIAPASEIAFRVAREGASRISPAGDLGVAQLGEPPQSGERVVIFTDGRGVSQCSTCPATPVLGRTDLEETIADLYGPRAGGQTRSWNLTSFSMADLSYALGERPPPDPLLTLREPSEVLDAVEAADWLIFSVLSSRNNDYGSNSLQLLLDRRPDQLQGKQVVVFAFDVPYVLDATDVSKIDRFYALYGPGESSVNTAARILFQELVPRGASPVGVPGVGYELLQILSPDPGRTIELSISRNPESAPQGTAEVGFGVGDVVVLAAGPILDRNGHTAPDGTPVQFFISFSGEGLTPVLEATTSSGVAQTEIVLERVGLHTIRAASDPARVSQIVQLDVQEGIPAFATVIAPTPLPTFTPGATDTAAAATEAVGGTGSSGGATPAGSRRLPGGALGIAIGLGAVAGAAGAILLRRYGASRRDQVRGGVVGAIGVLLGFNYLALGFPGSAGLMSESPVLGLGIASMLGGLGGLMVALLWWRRGWRT